MKKVIKKCRHRGWWFEIKILCFKKKYLWCDKCLNAISEKEIFKNAELLHRRGDGYFWTYYPKE